MSFVGHNIAHSPRASPSGLRYAMVSAFPFNYPSTDITAAPVHGAKKMSGSALASPGPKATRKTPKLPDAFNQHHAIMALRESSVSGRPRRSSFAVSAVRAPDSLFTNGPASPGQVHQQKKPRRLSFAELPAIARDPQPLRLGGGVVGLGFVASEEGNTGPSITKSRRDSIVERVPTPYPKDEEAESYFDLRLGTSKEKM
ncbi:hypothetical protein M407DRAFT_5165 [Tulasnella calospora MUT 4182]|uniref:Uncharacterized protein n=1 Tax=Tulasnella calospora MUT 4182 TaxID=1051891 RepID=A0A0C3QST2_9AGAM|nr:hypothetical protein M407DRAFT_5165 [Tulasnella calospora MUT 4182]